MRMIRLLHIADVHLGASMAPFGDAAESRRRALLDAFRRLPELARRHDAHAVLVAGDLFDGPHPDAASRAAVAETFARLEEDARPVFVVPGNHDSATLHQHPYSEPLGGARIFLGAAFERLDVETSGGPLHVYGLAYDLGREDAPLATYARADLPGAHVVLLHASAEFSPHWRIGKNALRLPLDALAGLACDYVALGDYHGFRPPERFHGGPLSRACYPGSFAALDATEIGPRGYVVVEIESGVPPRVAHHPGGVPPVQDVGEVDVGGAADHEEVIRRVAERVEPGALPLVRLVGVPDFAPDAELLTRRLQERFGFGRVVDASSYYASGRLDRIADDDTVAGHVVRLGRRRVAAAESADDRAIAERALRIALRALEVS
jgi:DNA repair exonuclease SbcCD nuclease subunit